MKQIKNLLTFFLLFFSMSFMMQTFAANVNSPVGVWKTIDDVTGQPKSIIQIYANSDQTLSGKVMKIFPSPGKDENEVCEACKGAWHNQKIVGMVILEGMKANGNKWDGGQILDPKNGKTYRCTFKLSNNGGELNVRGYIGISAFGRSQVWLRVK